MPKQRVRRLRKKLHVGEFMQLGFDVSFRFGDNVPQPDQDRFWEDFIMGLVEANAFSFGGGTSGFLVPDDRRSATDADRDQVRGWFAKRPEIAAFEVGSLVDAWHAPASAL